MASENTQRSGITTMGLLGVVFVTLKLIGVIDWSWWLVTAPFWWPFAVIAAIFFVGASAALFKRISR